MGITTQSNPTFNKLEVIKTGTLEFTAFVNQGTFGTIEHNLGFVPIVIATVKSPNFPGQNRAMAPYWNGSVSTDKVFAQVSNVRIDLVQFEVNLGSAASGDAGTWEFNYYLLRENA